MTNQPEKVIAYLFMQRDFRSLTASAIYVLYNMRIIRRSSNCCGSESINDASTCHIMLSYWLSMRCLDCRFIRLETYIDGVSHACFQELRVPMENFSGRIRLLSASSGCIRHPGLANIH